MGETNPKLCSEQRRIRSFAGILKALSLRPAFQPTSTPEQASRLFVKMQRRFLNNKCPVIRTCSAMLNAQSLAADPFQLMPSIFCFEDDQDQVRHRTEYCSRVSLNPSIGLLFVVTGSSCAPSILFGLCFCVFGGLFKGQLLAVPPPKLVAAARPNVRSLQTAFVQMESLAAFFLSTEEVRNSVAASQRAGLCI